MRTDLFVSPERFKLCLDGRDEVMDDSVDTPKK